jgi:nitroreductase
MLSTEAPKTMHPPEFIEAARRNFEYDKKRFLASALHAESGDAFALQTALTLAYHKIEKGLTMENPKPGFARIYVRYILDFVPKLEASGNGGLSTECARGALAEYVRFHDVRDLPLPEDLALDLRRFVAEADGQRLRGGTRKVTRQGIQEAAAVDFDAFIKARHSIRHFTGESVDPAVIVKAVEQATKAPRTCNREIRRVYVAVDREMKNHVLSYQRGNAGFGESIGAVLIVCADTRGCTTIDERHVAYVDGSLFAMTLVLALHAAGLGTCMLNWAEACDQDARLRSEFKIPDHLTVVTFIGVGHLPETLEVAASNAPAAQELITFLDKPGVLEKASSDIRDSWY